MPEYPFGGKPKIPTGHIVMWNGLLSEIPSGWVLCDGNNGTPNLLGRFVHGVPDGTTDPGTTGGTDSQTISTSQLPSHGHGGSTGNAGYHYHTFGIADGRIAYDGSGDLTPDGSYGNMDTSNVGNHSHNNTYSNTTGGGSSYDNRPAYYELAFIMKT